MPKLYRTGNPHDLLAMTLKGGGTLFARVGMVSVCATPAPGVGKDENGKTIVMDGSTVFINVAGHGLLNYVVQDEADEIAQLISIRKPGDDDDDDE